MNSSDPGNANFPLGLPTPMPPLDPDHPTRVLGIGVDIVETSRIQSSIDRFGDRFLARIFTQAERDYCGAMPYPARHYGARFAAKEAVSKAFGTGIGKQVGWRDIEVKRKETGEPYILLHGSAADFAASLNVHQALISLSHSAHYAVANAILIAKL